MRLTLFASDMSKGTVSAAMGMLQMLIFTVGIEISKHAWLNGGNGQFNLFNLVNGILWLSLMVIFLKDKQMGNSARRVKKCLIALCDQASRINGDGRQSGVR